mmetsp:Transcript_3454/g.8900  ORF Transcript_3454/g.8900 Transcript_3454/m.8900 type:complete len:218 (-) Transcript_3454:230-883(-)
MLAQALGRHRVDQRSHGCVVHIHLAEHTHDQMIHVVALDSAVLRSARSGSLGQALHCSDQRSEPSVDDRVVRLRRDQEPGIDRVVALRVSPGAAHFLPTDARPIRVEAVERAWRVVSALLQLEERLPHESKESHFGGLLRGVAFKGLDRAGGHVGPHATIPAEQVEPEHIGFECKVQGAALEGRKGRRQRQGGRLVEQPVLVRRIEPLPVLGAPRAH